MFILAQLIFLLFPSHMELFILLCKSGHVIFGKGTRGEGCGGEESKKGGLLRVNLSGF